MPLRCPQFQGFGAEAEARQKEVDAAFFRKHYGKPIVREPGKAEAEIKFLVAKLGRCLLPESLLWPDEPALERLNEMVLELCGRIGRQTRWHSFWRDYRAVDHYFTSFKLCETVRGLVRRAHHNVPGCPFERLTNLLREDGPRADKARELWRLWASHTRGEPNLGAEDWTRFSGILQGADKEVTPKVKRQWAALPKKERGKDSYEGSPGLRCYTVYLEWREEQTLWKRRHFDGSHVLVGWARGVFPKSEAASGLLARFEHGDPDAIDASPNDPDIHEAVRAELKRDSLVAATRRSRAKKSPRN